MRIINTAYVETASGVYDYNTSINRAVDELGSRGITASTYQRGNKLVNYSIEGIVRRDVLTAVNALVNDSAIKTCDLINAEYVEVSQHLGARVNLLNEHANHAGWQGGVYKIRGKDSQYRNLEQVTGYPSDPLGLGGYNCRHRVFPFYPGISKKKPIMYSLADNEEMQKLTQRQRSYERAIRRTKREIEAVRALGDNADEQLLARLSVIGTGNEFITNKIIWRYY
jgi:hypothetical protein